MRSGDEYIASLSDGRAVYLDGQRVEDVANHPAFAGAVRTIAGAYDAVNGDPSNTYVDPDTGKTHSIMWRIPHSVEDLRARRRMHEAWARPSYGLMGRTPDQVGSHLMAFRASSGIFRRQERALEQHVIRFYEQARDEDLYVSVAIVPPQIDRSKPAHQQPEPFLYAGACEERTDGVVIRGAQMIGTGAVLSNWLLFGQIIPLQPGDEDYAVSCVMPIDTPGLRIYPRRPYATLPTSDFDYPLSSRYDETDSVVVFDDVFVPWENVFVYRDIHTVNAQWNETGAHTLGNYQALCRFLVKLNFAAGLTKKLTELHGVDKLPAVQNQLGHGVGTIATMMEAFVLAAENTPTVGENLTTPSDLFLYTAMNVQRQEIVEFMRSMRELAGGACIALPSSERAFLSDETREHTNRYYQSSGASAEERVKLLRLIWDFVGTEFAGRQLQYEMFYSAAQHIADARVYAHFDWDVGGKLVETCLASQSLGNAATPAPLA